MKCPVLLPCAVLVGLLAFGAASTPAQTNPAFPPPAPVAPSLRQSWLARWDAQISGEVRGYRMCDRAVGEDIAWKVTPMMDGFYYGYLATRDPKYLDFWVDWSDSLIKRAVTEPDGFPGWPGPDPFGTQVDHLDALFGDSLLGDAMVFRPIVLLAGEVRRDSGLRAKYGAKAESYVQLAERLYAKWEQRGGWRPTEGGGMISVVGYYGLDPQGHWTEPEAVRRDPRRAFSHPNNKANEVAVFWLALADVTGKAEYRRHAEQWFQVLHRRLHAAPDGTFAIWNYWEPAGPWDYRADGRNPKHWVGVHPRPGYYEIDVAAIVAAYQHGLVFTAEDLARLIRTAKTTWADASSAFLKPGGSVVVETRGGVADTIYASLPNSPLPKPVGATPASVGGKLLKVQWQAATAVGEIVVQPLEPGAAPVTLALDGKTKVQALRMWTALAPYDREIQARVEATMDPESWGGLAGVPAYLSAVSPPASAH